MKKYFLSACCLLITSFLFLGCTLTQSNKQKAATKDNSSSVSKTLSNSTITSLGNQIEPSTITLSITDPVSCIYDDTPVIIKDTLYIINHSDNNNLYSIPISSIKSKSSLSKVDFSDIHFIRNDSTFSITSDSNYIYYNNKDGLSKFNFDKKEKLNFSNVDCSNIYASGDSLFYINKNDNNTLYKYSINENSSYKITKNSVLYYAVSGDTIIYINKDDNYRIYAISSNGSSNTKISNYSVSSFAICDSKIYFCDLLNNNSLHYSNLDGSNITKLTNYPCESLYCDKNGIYFLNNKDFNTVYRISYDGKTTKKLYSESLSSYSLVDKYIIITRKIDKFRGLIEKS